MKLAWATVAVATVLAGVAVAQAPKAKSGAAPQASFDCAKAATDVEKSICASPTLRRLDSQIARAYRTALARYTGPAAQALRDNQRDFNRTRDFAGSYAAAVSLEDMLRGRLVFLQSLEGPRTMLLGRWQSGNGDLSVKRTGDRRMVTISSVDPIAGRWICQIENEPARVVQGNAQAASIDAGEGWTVRLEFKDGLMHATQMRPPNDPDSIAPHCGNAGSVDGIYFPSR